MTPVDAAVDANTHLLRGAGRPVPEDYFRSFIARGEAGIVEATLARDLAPAAPARFGAYVVAVERFLERQGL